MSAAEKTLTLGGQIARAREADGMSQHGLGKIARVSVRTIDDWERDAVLPSPREFSRMCAALPRLMHLRHSVREEWEKTQLQPEPPAPPVPGAPPKSEFADALRGARAIEGLSQDELASLVGVARNAVHEWEHGLSIPVREHWEALADLFPGLPAPRGMQDISPPVGNRSIRAGAPPLAPPAVVHTPPAPPPSAPQGAPVPSKESPMPPTSLLAPVPSTPTRSLIATWVGRVLLMAQGRATPSVLADMLDAAERDGIAPTELAALIRTAREGMQS